MKTSSKELSVLSFNTYGIPFIAPSLKRRYIKFAQLIEESSTDILLLQEVSTYYHLRILKKQLPSYPYLSFQPHFYGPKGGLVIFSKLPIENTQYKSFIHEGSFTNISFYTKILKNGALICKLKDLPLLFVNTHLITDFTFTWSKENKMYLFVKAQLHELAAIVNDFEQTNNAIIVAGDFNIAKESPLYRGFVQKTQMKDLFLKDSFPTYYNDRISKHFRADTSARIDYIFLKNNTSLSLKPHATSYLFNEKYDISRREKSYLSDHIGLHCTLDVNS